ncbi:MAG: polysaccharide deacetylase family protein, partial [Methanosarcinaceae archaeon]
MIGTQNDKQEFDNFRVNKAFEKLIQNEHLWELYTKEEEYNPQVTDSFERFPYYLSKHRDVFEPTVSRFLIENGLKPYYPDGKKFGVCLTHDIDVVCPTKLSPFVDTAKSLYHRQFKNALKSPFSRLNKNLNPFWNFRDIMELEDKYNAKSSFYFLASNVENQDYSYEIENLKDEIAYISNNGWEMGLHGGHESYNDLEDLKKKKEKLENVLGKKVIGYRNHYLRFKTPDTWEILSKAGFKYDTTFGYNDCSGFRNGMCHPFKPFNLNTGKEIEILEIPLTIMDCTLFGDYMRLDFNKSWELTKQLIDTVESYNGVITILWHNTYMQDDNLKFYKN